MSKVMSQVNRQFEIALHVLCNGCNSPIIQHDDTRNINHHNTEFIRFEYTNNDQLIHFYPISWFSLSGGRFVWLCSFCGHRLTILDVSDYVNQMMSRNIVIIMTQQVHIGLRGVGLQRRN